MSLSSQASGLLLVALAGACVRMPATEQGPPRFPAPAPSQASFPSDAYIQTLLEEVVRDGRTVGVVVGLLHPDGSRRVFAHGSSGSHARQLDGESVFEIGSITKVFTGILLADMIRRGEVQVTEPVAHLLPPGARVPSRNGKQITLLDLATHRSGLPSRPTNFAPIDPANPYADYTVQQLYDFLASYELPREPGESFEYSNLGVGLLGHALGLRAGASYEGLLTERILAPLHLARTGITSVPKTEQHLAKGHDRAGYPQPNWSWDNPTLAGAGALRSTVSDMLSFAAANLSADTTALHAAMRDALRVHRPSGQSGEGLGLGWGISRIGGIRVAAHAGRTYGYSSYLALDLTTRRAVVVLSNSFSDALDGLDEHLLDPTVPLPKPSVWVAVATAYRTGGLDGAIQRYRTLRATDRDRWRFDESALITVGDWLLWRGQIHDAVAILQLNVEAYPEAPEPHARLGAAFMAAERPEEAVESYHRAVALAEAAGHPSLARYRASLAGAVQQIKGRD